MKIKDKLLSGLSLLSVFVALSLSLPKITYAHAFGQLYTLPIPVWLYLYGGGAAVFISFVLIGYFVSNNPKDSYPVFDLSRLKFGYLIPTRALIVTLKCISISVFCLIIATGYLGTTIANYNFGALFVWITFWLGFTYATAIFGNIWKLVNPWKIFIEIIEKFKGAKFNGILGHADRLGYVPALLFYFAFIWIELLSNGWGVRPAYLATTILIYSVINIAGVVLIGTINWFKYFEFFSVFFNLISLMAPIGIDKKHLVLRLPFAGLLEQKSARFSLLLFILFMLSSTAFDGFRGTTAWKFVNMPLLQLNKSVFLSNLSQIILLVLSLLIFLMLYLYAITFLKMVTKSKLSFRMLAAMFAPSLLPIALAYNVAHYYTLLIIQGQSMISTLSDPFGYGWNLFGTAAFMPNIGVVSASFVWHSQVAVIIIGHIAAVYIAHVISLKIFSSHKQAIISQLPMLLLMIIYTVSGLWILSQPLTLGR